jgi:outer membrane protein TolC
MKKTFLLPLVMLTVGSQQAWCMNFDSYKAQVEENDPLLKAQKLQRAGAELNLGSEGLITGVRLVSQFNYMNDQRPTFNPGFQGNQTNAQVASIGLQQQTPWGMRWGLSQNFQRTQVFNASPMAVPIPDFVDSFAKVEVSLPLWRNGGGAETKAQIEQAQAGTLLQKHQADIALTQRYIEIEAAYDQLAHQQETVEISKDSLERTKKLLASVQSKVQRGLADQSDLYQAQAAVTAREVDLVNARIQLRDAARSFNKLKNIPGEEVSEKLASRALSEERLKLDDSRVLRRKDYLIQQESIRNQRLGATVQREGQKPQLELSGQYLRLGRTDLSREVENNVFSFGKPYLAVGLNFSMPLDQATAGRSREGLAMLAESEEYQQGARVNDERASWQQMVNAGRQLGEQHQLVMQLEKVQKLKANAERDKYNRGRSTSFQVLSYEQDYVNSRAQLLAVELQIRKFVSQLRMFE